MVILVRRVISTITITTKSVTIVSWFTVEILEAGLHGVRELVPRPVVGMRLFELLIDVF